MGKRYNSYELYDNYGVGYTFKGEPFAFSVEDFEKVRDICWHRDVKGYISGTIDGQLVRMHRFLMDPPDDMVIDHKNHCLTDNRRVNLAVVTQSQNMQNMMPNEDNEFGCRGVRQVADGIYIATICANGESITLGYFDTPEEAIAARKEAERKYYGEHSYDANMAQAEEYGYVDVPGIIPEIATKYGINPPKPRRKVNSDATREGKDLSFVTRLHPDGSPAEIVLCFDDMSPETIEKYRAIEAEVLKKSS